MRLALRGSESLETVIVEVEIEERVRREERKRA